MNANLKFPVTVERLSPFVSGDIRMNWCEENIGQLFDKWDCQTWSTISPGGEVRFTFEKEEDALLFALRWAGQ